MGSDFDSFYFSSSRFYFGVIRQYFTVTQDFTFDRVPPTPSSQTSDKGSNSNRSLRQFSPRPRQFLQWLDEIDDELQLPIGNVAKEVGLKIPRVKLIFKNRADYDANGSRIRDLLDDNSLDSYLARLIKEEIEKNDSLARSVKTIRRQLNLTLLNPITDYKVKQLLDKRLAFSFRTPR